jgi:hypothetical protein
MVHKQLNNSQLSSKTWHKSLCCAQKKISCSLEMLCPTLYEYETIREFNVSTITIAIFLYMFLTSRALTLA